MKLKKLLKEALEPNTFNSENLREFKTKLAAEIAKSVKFPIRIYIDEGDFDGDISNSEKCTNATVYAKRVIQEIFERYDDFSEFFEMYEAWESESLTIDTLVKTMCRDSVKNGRDLPFGVSIDENTALVVWEDEE